MPCHNSKYFNVLIAIPVAVANDDRVAVVRRFSTKFEHFQQCNNNQMNNISQNRMQIKFKIFEISTNFQNTTRNKAEISTLVN